MSKRSRSEAEILAEMVRFPVSTRGELGARLGHSKASVSRAVDRLLKDGSILEAGKQAAPRRGRRVVSLRVRPDLAYLVGADLEGLAARACVIDASRRILASGKRVVNPAWSMPRTAKMWASLIEDVIVRAGIDRARIVGLGVGLPGVVLSDGLRIRAYLPPDRRVDFNMGSMLETFGLPIAAANNILCVAEYERRVGLGRHVNSFVSVLARYGIGAAVFSDGHFLVGDGVFTGELGHMRVNVDGPVCVCGLRGCLDVYCSGRTWPPAARRTGAAWRRELARCGRYLGIGVSNLLKLCHVPLVILNGIYNAYEEDIRPPVEEAMADELAPLGLPAATVAFGDPVECKASIGAALRAADAFMTPHLMKGK